ncbi:hypothetical protein K0H71_04745 [Bacillus sp. IITD106]|nr:hypothetical protein [Bacillus sp. IITD106]
MAKEITKLPEEEAKRVLKLPNSYYEKGLKQGIKQGVEKGREQGIINMVYKMLEKGFSEDEIAELSNLSLSRIKEMKRKLDES